MVPEWQEAYMNYNHLKSLLKDIPKLISRSHSLQRTLSGLTRRNSNGETSSKCSNEEEDIENPKPVIQVKPKGSSSGRFYETKFLMSPNGVEGGENERLFFEKLDEEFNKVNEFYRKKVEEVMEEANELNKQMEALVALRIKVQSQDTEVELSDNMKPSSSAAAEDYKTRRIPDEKTSSERSLIDSDEILNRVNINTTNETPFSTLRSILKFDEGKEMGRETLKNVEDQLKSAFIQFYQKLHLLKNYSFFNLLAFSKIVKKYDKVTRRKASKSYMNMVDNSYIGNSDEITRLLEMVEATFIKHFSNSNRRKGMVSLRPKVRKEKHRTTFCSGFLSGCTFALLLSLIWVFNARKISKKKGFGQYMENMFPLYSLFGFIVLHMLLYAGNIYFWRRYRVNYSFIFNFKQGTELGYREVFLFSAGLATLALASVLANLDMGKNEETKDYKPLTELMPLGLVTLVVVITICPFNIMYRSSRFFLLNSLFRCICAPLYKVTLTDFFVADNLTSQVQALRSIEFYICYYSWGDFKQRRNTCKKSDVYNTFYYIVGTLPFWSRLLQCLRRLCEEREIIHVYNGLKYFSMIVAIVMRTAYSLKSGLFWQIVALITSVIATIFVTYWDIVIDWGLLRKHSKNRWLRDKLILSYKSIYFIVIMLNILLRFNWLNTALNFQVTSPDKQILIAVGASLEIIRRGIWNFFRLENEHLNNVGKYRAFKSVPLPFNYDEDEGADELEGRTHLKIGRKDRNTENGVNE